MAGLLWDGVSSACHVTPSAAALAFAARQRWLTFRRVLLHLDRRQHRHHHRHLPLALMPPATSHRRPTTSTLAAEPMDNPYLQAQTSTLAFTPSEAQRTAMLATVHSIQTTKRATCATEDCRPCLGHPGHRSLDLPLVGPQWTADSSVLSSLSSHCAGVWQGDSRVQGRVFHRGVFFSAEEFGVFRGFRVESNEVRGVKGVKVQTKGVKKESR